MEVTLRKQEGVDLRFYAPPSKSYTHRGLIAAAIAEGESHVMWPLRSDDTEITRRALQAMGVPFRQEKDGYRISGSSGELECPKGLELDMDNSGTSYRLLTSVALLCGTPVVITGSDRMKERPVGPLVSALNQLGGDVRFLEKPGYPPVRVGGRFRGGTTRVEAGISSQFVSSLLLAGPYALEDVEIRVLPGLVSPSYLDITLDVMGSFGARVDRDGYEFFRVPAGTPYRGTEYPIEGDFSAASYFFALAALCRGRVRVENLNPRSCQGDRRFVTALQAMGCRIRDVPHGMEVEYTGDLEGITVDMSTSPDTVQTLCMVAAMARTPSRISGISHLKFKESDRLEGTARLLRSLGGNVKVEKDALVVFPSRLHGGEIDPEGDHRTAMSFAVLGLAIGNVKILHAECVSKSFPGFWEILREQNLI